MSFKILVIDDEPTTIKLVQSLFEKKGYKVIVATDGDEGLEKAQEIRPHLIILDIIMPRIDGLTFMTKIQRIPEIRNIPVIVLTSHVRMAPALLSKGAKAFVEKPFNDDVLVKKVESYLNPS